MNVLLKSPTLKDLHWCTLMRGCLFPVNQGSLFFAGEIEKYLRENNILTQQELDRKAEIEQVFKFGFYIDEIEDTYIPESIANTCYQMIVSGLSLVDIDNALICPAPSWNTLRQPEKDMLNDLRKIKLKIDYMNEFSYDAIIDRFYNYFLLTKCLFKTNGQPVFSEIKDLLVCEPNIINVLYSRFIEYRHYIPESVYRYIARGDGEPGRKWMATWNTAKSIGSSPFEEMDENKMTLCRWTERYENITSMVSPPGDDIISNDTKLDNWLFKHKIERNNKNNTSGVIDGMCYENKNQERSYIPENGMTFEVG